MTLVGDTRLVNVPLIRNTIIQALCEFHPAYKNWYLEEALRQLGYEPDEIKQDLSIAAGEDHWDGWEPAENPNGERIHAV